MVASIHGIECGGAAAATAKTTTAAAAAEVSTLLLMFCVSANFVSYISQQPQRSDVDVTYENMSFKLYNPDHAIAICNELINKI